jgi:hypothetical protein
MPPIVLAATLLTASAATGQNAAPAPADAAQTPAASSQPRETGQRPGFFDALGRWFSRSRAVIDSQVRSTGDALGTIGSSTASAAYGAAGAAKQTAATIIGLPGTRLVSGREPCAVAQNGAPDCAAAIGALCRSRGMQSGSSIEIATSRKCDFRGLISGHSVKCRTEAFVTKAVCQ